MGARQPDGKARFREGWLQGLAARPCPEGRSNPQSVHYGKDPGDAAIMTDPVIRGYIAPGFEVVKSAFAANFSETDVLS